ncbi:MAG TPA: DUF1080 domain-containing protein [Abditibacteriaceae bacterium]|jgi:hypothetical protein
MKPLQKRIALSLGVAFVGGTTLSLCAQNNFGGFQDTPIVPGTKWHVHDNERPQPEVITPGTFSTQEAPGKAPSDAIVLFDGTNLDKWRSGDEAAKWDLVDGAMQVKPKTGELTSKDEFGDCQLHIEWSAPNPPTGNSQGRGNSGLFMMNRYEIQILDNYNNPTYADGTASAVYGQTPPQVNAIRPPGEWNVYDIIWQGPRFKDGKLEKPAYVTILVNGVVTQNHTMLIGDTPFKNVGKYNPHGETGPIRLQDHGNPMRFRNIWVRPLRPVEQLTIPEAK